METMQIKTAAALYDVNPRMLQNFCTRGDVKAQLVGGRYFITPAEMDRVFKGIKPVVAGKAKK